MNKKIENLAEELYYAGGGDQGRGPELAKGLLSVSYLLQSLTDGGNESLDGRIASGLGITLRHYADVSARLKREEGERPLERPSLRVAGD